MILIKHINSCFSKIFIFCTLQITCIYQLGKILWKDNRKCFWSSNLVFYKRNKTIWDFQVYIRSNDSINNRISHRETIIWMSKPDKNKSTNYLYRYSFIIGYSKHLQHVRLSYAFFFNFHVSTHMTSIPKTVKFYPN